MVLKPLNLYHYALNKIHPNIDPCVASVGVSDICNLNCIMCTVRTQRHMATNTIMSLDVYKDVLSRLPPSVKVVTPAGLGEVTLHPEFPQIVESTLCAVPNVSLVTNGTRLQDYIPAFLKVKSVFVSLDASTRERYLKIRRADQFDTIISGITKLIQAGHPNVQLNFVLQPESADDVIPFITLAKKLGIHQANILPRVIINPRSFYYCNLSQAYAYAQQVGIVLTVSTRGDLKTCISPLTNFVVDINWNVHYCCIGWDVYAGNLHDNTWHEIWYGRKMSVWRKSVLSPGHQPTYCQTCAANMQLSEYFK